jgi:hypothetical protein
VHYKQRWALALFSCFRACEREAKKEREGAKKKEREGAKKREREKSESAERESKKREFALFPPPKVEIRFRVQSRSAGGKQGSRVRCTVQ